MDLRKLCFLILNIYRDHFTPVDRPLCVVTVVLVFTCVSYAEARNRYSLDICLSVCLSHAGTLSKRLNILS